MKVKTLFLVVLIILAIWSAFCYAKPYWTKYQIGQEMEEAAIYGTIHEIEETIEFIAQKSKAQGWPFKAEDFKIVKNEFRDVTITLKYTDDVKIFGFLVKNLDITIKKQARFIKQLL